MERRGGVDGLAWRAATYVAALGLVGLVSLLISTLAHYASIANLSMLYLIAVLVSAIAFGRGPAIAASVAAFLTFDWFFVEPHHTFVVASLDEWVALLLFLATAIATGQLAAQQRLRAEESHRREREAVVLYDVGRLIAEHEFETALPLVAERLRAELGLRAVAIDLAPELFPAAHVEAGDRDLLLRQRSQPAATVALLKAGTAPTAEARGETGRWVRVVRPGAVTAPAEAAGQVRLVPVRRGEERAGTLTLVSAEGAPAPRSEEDRLLAAVAAQLGLAAERARLQREAVDAEVLRRTDRLRTALLNAVSHDLRTPLASIVASAGSLLQGDVDWTEAERREFAEAIDAEARRLNRIVGNLLDLSRLQAGSLTPELAWHDLRGLVDDVVGRLAGVTARHRVAVELPDDLPPVRLDYVEIDQVLSNLIENAVKFAPPGSEIRVSARREGGALAVEVGDQGPGLAPEALPRLFEPFFRAGAPGQRPAGTGLGLAVARGLVEAHGGTIRARNRPGGGASFVFTLPLAPAAAVAARPVGVAS